MRKSFILLTVLAVAATSLAVPAVAGKSKTKKGSFTAEAAPYPGPEGCNGSMAQVTEELKVTSNGVFTVTMVDFMGDWDLFVNDADGNELGSATASQLTGDAPEEQVVVGLRKGAKVVMGPCNWAGGPSATVNWEFKPSK